MGKKRKLAIFGGFVLYNLISGGGFVLHRADRFALANGPVQLTDGASVYLAGTPTKKGFYVPFVFYYVNETYPVRMRFYGSTRDGSISVVDEEQRARFGDSDTYVVVTEVLYYQKLDDEQPSTSVARFKESSWNDIVIRGPGEWIVESKGYEETEVGGKRALTFPTMTIRRTERGRTRILRGFTYLLEDILSRG